MNLAVRALAVTFVPGQSFANSLLGNFWLALVVKLILVMGIVLLAPLVVIYSELKIMAHMQHRLGPMYAGRFVPPRSSSPTSCR